MRRVLKPLWILLALLFLAEAWLWEHLEPVVARLVALLPLERLKAWLAARVANMSPAATLLVFLAPVVLLFPLKIAGLWMLAHHYWLGACSVLALGKMAGVGIAAFIFDTTRPKLMQLDWFAACYAVVIRVRGWALTMVEPVQTWLRGARATFSGEGPRWLRRLRRTRRRVLAAR